MKNRFNLPATSLDADSIQQTIQRALAAAGLDTSSRPMHDVTETIRRALASAGLAGGGVKRESIVGPSPDKASQAPGTFEAYEFGNHAGTRSYKLYVPSRTPDGPRPMVVMLHGCTQSADDFAAGTRMNRLAEEQGFLVVYPEQAAHVNASKCWNWFKPQHQLRDAGEPALIAGMVGDVAQRHDADPRRIFIAGLSAGAAMAVVLGETYPELFAAVGAHSGLPYGSAHDTPSAMAAMKGGRSGLPGLRSVPGGAAAPSRKAVQPLPIIVFHGDRDHTVQPSNAAEIVEQARAAHGARSAESELIPSTQSGTAPGGRRYSLTLHADDAGRVLIESWTLHGAGHAWAGGDARGSYTDVAGPDASAEMVRFFLAQPRAGSA